MSAPSSIRWQLSHRCDPRARVLADDHYSRQTVGAKNFVQPGRCLVLYQPALIEPAPKRGALWVSVAPFAEYVKHEWPSAWSCAMFRNIGAGLSSELIRQAVAITRWRWPDVPALGMVTFVDAGKVRAKRDPGRCFKKAGFRRPFCSDCAGKSTRERRRCTACAGSGYARTKAGLIVWQMVPEDMPPASPPMPAQPALEFAEVAQ